MTEISLNRPDAEAIDALTNFSIEGSLETVWGALHAYRDEQIPADFPTDTDVGNDEQWDDICTAMAWITEALGHEPT